MNNIILNFRLTVHIIRYSNIYHIFYFHFMFFEKSDFANFVTERHVCLCAKSFKNQTSSSFSIEIRETNITLESQKSSVRQKFQTSSIHLHVYTHLSYSLISVARQFAIFFEKYVDSYFHVCNWLGINQMRTMYLRCVKLPFKKLDNCIVSFLRI